MTIKEAQDKQVKLNKFISKIFYMSDSDIEEQKNLYWIL